MSTRLYQAVIVIVTVVWVANLAAGALPGYDPDPAINGIFGVIVGGAMVLQQRGPRAPRDNGDDKT